MCLFSMNGFPFLCNMISFKSFLQPCNVFCLFLCFCLLFFFNFRIFFFPWHSVFSSWVVSILMLTFPFLLCLTMKMFSLLHATHSPQQVLPTPTSSLHMPVDLPASYSLQLHPGHVSLTSLWEYHMRFLRTLAIKILYSFIKEKEFGVMKSQSALTHCLVNTYQ